jgi:hypothetical protein
MCVLNSDVIKPGLILPTKFTRFYLVKRELQPQLRQALVNDVSGIVQTDGLAASCVTSPFVADVFEARDKAVIRRYPVIKNGIDQNEARKKIHIVTDTKTRNFKVEKAKEVRDALKIELERDKALSEKYGNEENEVLGRRAFEICTSAQEAFSLSRIEGEEYKARLQEALDMFDAIDITDKRAYQKDHLMPSVDSLEFSKVREIVKRITPEYMGDEEFATLVACFLTKNSKNPDGVCKLLPKMIVSRDEGYEVRIKTLYEHLFVDLLKKNNILAIEQFSGWKSKLKNLGLDQVTRLGIVQGISDGFPVQLNNGEIVSLFHGENPPLRMWEMDVLLFGNEAAKTDGTSEECSIPGIVKIDQEEVKRNSSAWCLQYGLGLVDADGKFKSEEARKISWKAALEEHKMQRVIEKCGGVRKVVELGYKTLQDRRVVRSEQPLVGQGKDQLHEWDFQRQRMWQDEISHGMLMIDLITDYIVEDLKTRNPDIFTQGKLNEKAGQVNWNSEYNSVVLSCCEQSGTTHIGALRRRHSYLPASFEDTVRISSARPVENLDSENGRQFAIESLVIDFAKCGLGILDRSKTLPIYTLSRDQLVRWVDENTSDRGFITAELVSDATQQRLYKAFDKTLDAYKTLFGNGEPLQIKKGPKVLSKGLLLNLLPEVRSVCFSFTGGKMISEEQRFSLKAKAVRGKICHLYANPFLEKAENLKIPDPNKNTAIEVLETREDSWRRLSTIDKYSLRDMTSMKDARGYLVSGDNLREVVISIRELIPLTTLTLPARVRFARHLDLLLDPEINPRMVLERVGRVPNGERYNSMRLLEDSFRLSLDLLEDRFYTKPADFPSGFDPTMFKNQTKRTILNLNNGFSSGLVNFIAHSMIADVIVRTRYDSQTVESLESFSLQKDCEAIDYHYANNAKEARKAMLVSISLERLCAAKRAGIQMARFENMAFDELCLYANQICGDLGLEPSQNQIIEAVKKNIRSDGNPRGILQRLPEGFPNG